MENIGISASMPKAPALPLALAPRKKAFVGPGVKTASTFEPTTPTVVIASQEPGDPWKWNLEGEVGPIIGLFPDRGIDIGGRIGLGLFTWPDSWWLVGGHEQFLSFLLAKGYASMGADIAITNRTEKDNKMRIGVSVWREEGANWGWNMYLAGALVSF
jgi:hypothetical protein